MIMTEPIKTISCANGTLKEPIDNVKITKTKLPPNIHQFIFVFSLPLSSLNSRPLDFKVCIFLCLKYFAKITPSIETKGITRA